MTVVSHFYTLSSTGVLVVQSEYWAFIGMEESWDILYISACGYVLFTPYCRPIHPRNIHLQLLCMGAFASASAIGTRNVNDVQPHYKRSTAVGLDLPWPSSLDMRHGYSMIHQGLERRQRSIWRLPLECVCLLLSTESESGWWCGTRGRRGSGPSIPGG